MKVAKVCGCLHYDKFSGTDYMVTLCCYISKNRIARVIVPKLYQLVSY